MTLKPADDAFATRLKSLLPDARIEMAEARYLEEPRGIMTGVGGLVVRPRTTEEVATAVKAAGEARVGIIPYGGGTGLVGGQVNPVGPAPMLLSLERMTKLREVYADEQALVAEAGMTIEAIQNAADDAGQLFALSYASKGTATIGAGLSVNSGGLNVLRYGTARAQCLGVEAVLPDGSVYNGLKRLRKDNTGYDLKNLLIGSEGTLGIITAASLALQPKPARRATAFLAVRDPAAALTLLSRLRHEVGEAVSAFELVSSTALGFLATHFPDLRQPFDDAPPWSVLVEIGTGPATDPSAALEKVFAALLEEDLVTDGQMAQSDAQRDHFWTLRETIPAANRAVGAVASHDIALPLGAVAEFMTATEPKVTALGALQVNAFGHLGDGNLHFNVFPAKGVTKAEVLHLRPEVTRLVHDQAAAFGGVFSAEHGVGRFKVGEAQRYGDPARLAAMRAIKGALDPLGIMNPGAVLPAD